MNKSRFSFLGIGAMTALLAFSSVSQAMPYTFEIDGFANGGKITGSFDSTNMGMIAPATPGDSIISNADGDIITGFMMAFVGGDYDGTMWDDMEWFGLKYDLDTMTLVGLMATDMMGDGLELVFGEAAETIYGFNSAILVNSLTGEILEANPPRPTPAPATLALFALGLVGLGLGRRRIRS